MSSNHGSDNPENKLSSDTENELLKDQIDREQTQLLQKMIQRQEKDILISRITAIAECTLLAALIIVFSLLVPKFLNTVSRVEETMNQIDLLIDQTEQSLITISDLAIDADELIISNDEAIAEAITNFNNVDFESLNESIANLADIIKPVVEIVHMFGD